MPKGRVKKPRYKELYGDYPTLNKLEVEYVKLASDPNNKLAKKTNQDIADMMGVVEVTVRKYRTNPIIRKAIAEETMMKASDDMGDMIDDLKNMALGGKKYKNIGITDQLKAKALWLKIFGLSGDDKRTKKATSVESSIDKELEELEREYKEDTEKMQT